MVTRTLTKNKTKSKSVVHFNSTLLYFATLRKKKQKTCALTCCSMVICLTVQRWKAVPVSLWISMNSSSWVCGVLMLVTFKQRQEHQVNPRFKHYRIPKFSLIFRAFRHMFCRLVFPLLFLSLPSLRIFSVLYLLFPPFVLLPLIDWWMCYKNWMIRGKEKRNEICFLEFLELRCRGVAKSLR